MRGKDRREKDWCEKRWKGENRREKEKDDENEEEKGKIGKDREEMVLGHQISTFFKFYF